MPLVLTPAWHTGMLDAQASSGSAPASAAVAGGQEASKCSTAAFEDFMGRHRDAEWAAAKREVFGGSGIESVGNPIARSANPLRSPQAAGFPLLLCSLSGLRTFPDCCMGPYWVGVHSIQVMPWQALRTVR